MQSLFGVDIRESKEARKVDEDARIKGEKRLNNIRCRKYRKQAKETQAKKGIRRI